VEVGEATGTSTYVGDRLFRHVPETQTLIVFMAGDRPVCGYAWRGGYLEALRREFGRADAVFRVEKRCTECPAVLHPVSAPNSGATPTGLTSRFSGPGFALRTPATERER
jgi:hypothetical protein